MTTTPTTTTTTPPSTPILFGPLNVEYLNESWCELQYKSGCSSTGSISHLNHSVNPEILEKLLQEAQKDASSQRQSPTLLPGPQLFTSHSNLITTQSNQTTLISSVKPNKKSILRFSKTALTLNAENRKMKASDKISTFCDLIGDEDDFDEDVDLEYVEDDDDDEGDNDDTNVLDENGEMSSYGTIRSKLKIDHDCLTKTCDQDDSSRVLVGCEPSASTPCPNCLKQKKQIDLLIERQVKNEKELIRMRNEYEVKLLNKSLEISNHQTTAPSQPAVVSSGGYNIIGHSSPSAISSAQSVDSSSSGATTPAQTSVDVNGRDWIKYFASRPQTQPPKEWNFIHPNSSKSKYAKLESTIATTTLIETVPSKFLSRESISKLIFTHMASFIVGATLMFLVLKRHFNFKNTIYFI